MLYFGDEIIVSAKEKPRKTVFGQKNRIPGCISISAEIQLLSANQIAEVFQADCITICIGSDLISTISSLLSPKLIRQVSRERSRRHKSTKKQLLFVDY